MDNETKLSAQQINSIINEAKNTDFKSGSSAEDFVKKHLGEKEAEKVKSILGDKEKMKKLMESPFAKRFMEGFMKKRNGEEDHGLK